MTVNKEEAKILPWDTNFWGFPVARVISMPDDDGDLLAWLASNEIVCTYFTAGASDLESVRRAERAGFELASVRLEYGISESDFKVDCGARSSMSSAEIRRATDSDLAKLKPIARDAHRVSRFFMDPMFPDDRCQEFYETWITNSLDPAWADFLLIAISGKLPVGYITGKQSSGEGVIGLVAVTLDAQGKGIGRSLVVAAIHELRSLGATKISVHTQGSNRGAIGLYDSCGMKLEKVLLDFHHWTRSRKASINGD